MTFAIEATLMSSTRHVHLFQTSGSPKLSGKFSQVRSVPFFVQSSSVNVKFAVCA